jgi:hypothetical protein
MLPEAEVDSRPFAVVQERRLEGYGISLSRSEIGGDKRISQHLSMVEYPWSS